MLALAGGFSLGGVGRVWWQVAWSWGGGLGSLYSPFQGLFRPPTSCSALPTFLRSSMADARWTGSFLSPSWMAWAVRGAQEGGISLIGGGSLAILRQSGPRKY